MHLMARGAAFFVFMASGTVCAQSAKATPCDKVGLKHDLVCRGLTYAGGKAFTAKVDRVQDSDNDIGGGYSIVANMYREDFQQSLRFTSKKDINEPEDATRTRTTLSSI